MTTTATPMIRTLDAEAAERRLSELTALLRACVHDGANINFMLPFPMEEAEGFWRSKVLPQIAAGRRVLWIAEIEERVAGAVQLDIDTPPNQPHRAEVAKLMAHPDFRRRGVAKRLMAALEEEAARRGRWLLTLDTRTGDKAEPLYLSLGYAAVGQIPDFCRDPIEDRLHPTTLMYKRLK